jgi:beta-lactamase class A
MSNPSSPEPDNSLAAIERHFSGRLSVAAVNLSTGEEVLLAPDREFPTASVFKIPILIEVFRQAEEGTLALDERVTLTASDVVRGSGVLRDLDLGLRPSIRDLSVLMIAVSDNTATNMLIRRLGGVEPINTTLRSLGMQVTTVHMPVDFERIGDDNRRLAVASARELMRLCQLLGQGKLISAAASSTMREILGRQHYLNQVPRYFSYNPYGPELGMPQALWIGCKTGALTGMRADAGLIGLPDGTQIAYAVMNEGSTDTGFTSENESEIVNGAVGKILLEHWWPEDGSSPPIIDSPYLARMLADSSYF